jgi:uncharacterized protein (TIGR01244 family)
MFTRLDEHMLVAGQIRPEDVASAKAEGVTTIVNNRPDGEEAGQPTSAEIEAAARAAGLAYRHIPVAAGFSAERVAAMAETIEDAEGKTLAFCTSGTRSTLLWALARSQAGEAADTLIGKAAAAGYDLGPIEAWLKR